MRAGLCSVTLRACSPAEVVGAAVRAGIECIEWGADVHVPPGALAAAGEVRGRTEDAGLRVASYGSYLWAGRIDDDRVDEEAEAVLDTAVALGAPNVRVWAKGSRSVAQLRVVALRAAERDVTVSLEFHPGTWTETAQGTLDLLGEVGSPALRTYWQPHPQLAVPALLSELEAVLPRLSHLHVFRWTPGGERLPLADGADLWPGALALASPVSPEDRVAFLEFVRDDDVDQLVADAATLRGWLGR